MLQHRLLTVTSPNHKFLLCLVKPHRRLQQGGWTEPLYSIVAGLLDYTTVQTVLSVVSKRTALASVGFMLVSYMGFSNDA